MFKVNAQSQCATDEYDTFLKRTNPTYAAERQKMEQQIYSILKNKQNNPNARIMQYDCQPSGVFTIPVVVHVIHKGEAIGTGFNMQMGYVFPSDVAVGFRYSQLNSNTQSAKFDEYNKFYSLVFTKYLSDHNCKFQIELGYDRLNDPIKKLTQDGNYYSQFMFTIQL